MTAVTLTAMFGDLPASAAFKRGDFAGPDVATQMTDVPEAHKLFKRVVRGLEFDVAELSVMTYLIAKSRGVPLTLLPAVLLARFQHPYIVYDARKGALQPKDLEGRRVGIRSITVTTVTWVRGMLVNDFGVDLDRVNWVTFEDAHVAGVLDPPGVERASEGKTLEGMLIAGELDAAIDVLLDEGLVDNAARLEPVMRGHMEALAAKHPSVRSHRNIGLFGMVDLQRDTAGTPMAPYNGSHPAMGAFNAYLRDNGLFTFVRWGSFMCNPPLCITEDELAESFAIIDKGLEITDKVVTG